MEVPGLEFVGRNDPSSGSYALSSNTRVSSSSAATDEEVELLVRIERRCTRLTSFDAARDRR